MPWSWPKRVLWILAWLALPLSWWGSTVPLDSFILIHLLTAAGLIALVFVDRRWPLDRLDVALLAVFLGLHIIGGRYAYSYTPYDAWWQALFGVELSELCDWQRNHYDRLVHAAFGPLVGWPLARLLHRQGWSRPRAWGQTLLLLTAAATAYELLEWGVAMTLEPEQAETFNGQQGDHFDPHADIALALAAFGLTAPWLLRRPTTPTAADGQQAEATGCANVCIDK